MSKNSQPYIIQFLAYFTLFWLIGGASATSFLIVFILYCVALVIAFMNLIESIWRTINAVRPLRLKSEKERLMPLFREIYRIATKHNPKINRKIKLYISEDVEINACAFGRYTMVITRGSIEFLSDEAIKGLLAHEFGHFSNSDTTLRLFSTVSNLFLSFLIQRYHQLIKATDNIVAKFILTLVFAVPLAVNAISDLVLLEVGRKQEYMADTFAVDIGYGAELAGVLIGLYQSSFGKPKSLQEQLNSTHPPITRRIELIEDEIY